GEGVDVVADITRMPFDDASFDGILCSHVLEHVEDDRSAMAELCRVVRPGGWVAVLVPLDLERTDTYEDSAVVTREQRERAYWQHDHVRLYAPDIADRLQEAGLEVEAVRVSDSLPAGAVRRHGILPGELIFHCTRPPLAPP
ncbi:MAG: methyltransferase domain-containing protein, partial [Actinomycetota bacterium]|nr:methyltransferase domain-containing protein [Actinomycetota bacterium]